MAHQIRRIEKFPAVKLLVRHMLGSVPAKRQHMVYAGGFQRVTVFLKVRMGKADAGNVSDRVDSELLLDEGGDFNRFSRPGTARAVGAADEIGMQFCRFPQKIKYGFLSVFFILSLI